MPLTVGVGGCLKPGGLFELLDGDRDEWEDWIPFVWTAGRGGRFILVWWGTEGFGATAVAILPPLVEVVIQHEWL